MGAVQVELDQDLVALLEELHRPVKQAARELIVLELYRQGDLSSGKAAQLLGLERQVGAGVQEIRIHVLGEWRVVDVARFAAAVYVLHAFQKKTQKTAKGDLEIARARYRQIGQRS